MQRPITRVPIDPVILRVPVYDSRTTLTGAILPIDTTNVDAFGQPEPALDPYAGVRSRMVRYGLPAMLLGTLGQALVAGLAFRSYRNTKSVVRPAVIIGVGGLAVSGLSMFLLLRALEPSADDRVAAMGAGLWLAK